MAAKAPKVQLVAPLKEPSPKREEVFEVTQREPEKVESAEKPKDKSPRKKSVKQAFEKPIDQLKEWNRVNLINVKVIKECDLNGDAGYLIAD
jgi:hypothetical protein